MLYLLTKKDEYYEIFLKKRLLFIRVKYWLITVITILSLFTIQNYTYFIFPEVTPNLGGGNPSIVQLVIKAKDFKKHSLQSLNLLEQTTNDEDAAQNNLISKSIFLIGENSKFYYLTPSILEPDLYIKEPFRFLYTELPSSINNYQAIQVKKEDVIAILYKKNKS